MDREIVCPFCENRRTWGEKETPFTVRTDIGDFLVYICPCGASAAEVGSDFRRGRAVLQEVARCLCMTEQGADLAEYHLDANLVIGTDRPIMLVWAKKRRMVVPWEIGGSPAENPW